MSNPGKDKRKRARALDGLLDALSVTSKFDPNMRTRIVREEDAYTLVFHHDLGPKWSIVVKGASQEFVRKSFLIEPRVTAGESVVTTRFKVNPPKRKKPIGL